MALNPSGAISLGGPATGQSIAVELGLSPTASISLNQTNVRTLAQVPSGTIIMPTNFWGKSNFTGTQKALFALGMSPIGTNVFYGMTNLVSSTGVVAADTPSVATVRGSLAAAGYGGDKAIIAYGSRTSPPLSYSMTNLVSNTGVVASDTPTVSSAKNSTAGAGYGGDKAIFAFGVTPGFNYTNTQNFVSNTGVLSADTPGVGQIRNQLTATSYGGDKAIFGYGLQPGASTSVTNLVSNTGVVAADTPGVGTVRNNLAAATYGGDKAIFGYGVTPTLVSMTNLVSNTGVVAADTPGVGTARGYLAAAGYGGDKAIFGYGGRSTPPATAFVTNLTNLVSNTGVVSTDTPGVGTSRMRLAAAGYSTTA